MRVAGAGAAAFIAGAGMSLVAWLSAGSLGTASLISLGPDPTVVAVLTVVLVAIGAIPAALAPRPPARPTLQVATPTESPVDASSTTTVGGSGADLVDDHGVSTRIGATDMTDETR